VRLAYWPGLGGGTSSFAEISPVLAARWIDSIVLDPRYGARSTWDLDTLADELAATGADVYAGHSWGGAIAARAAIQLPPAALVLLDGGFISPSEFARFGAKPTLDERIDEIREEHGRYRWPTKEAYLEHTRSESPRWNEAIELDALEGMRYENGEVLPPFDADELEAIVRGYDMYDAPSTLAALANEVRVLFVAATPPVERADGHDELLGRFRDLVPQGEIRKVESGHDVIWGLGPALGEILADWLLAEVTA
jgi:pimeloyl-ACP methyl ester carboxylesterase